MLIPKLMIRDALCVTCTFRNDISGSYFCELRNQVVESEDDLLSITGEHLPGFSDEDVLWITQANSRIVVFPSLLVDHFPNVVGVNLTETQMTSFVRPITNCIRLQTVILNDNRIRKITGGIFSNCPILIFLRFDGNNLDHLDEFSFVGLPNLNKLSLMRSNIVTLHPEILRPMINLATFDLRHNNLTNLNSNIFAQSASLSLIMLDDNNISTLDIKLFRNNHRLTHVSMRRNKISRIRAEVFSNKPMLYTIVLSHNQIEEIPIFKDLPSINAIQLHDNKVKTISAGTFEHIPNLRSLTLWRNQITNIESGAFRNLSQVTGLKLLHNNISELSPNAFIGLTSIESLHLSDNRLTHLDAIAFASLKTLKSLYIADNQVVKVERKLFDILPSLEWISLFGNICTDLGFLIDPANRILPDLGDCFSSSEALKVNLLVLTILTIFLLNN